jgi:periplasmic divalent cation tolerance protein
MSCDSEDVVVVLVTSPCDQASAIAHHLVEKRLAACVNIIPEIRSVYRWEDNIEDESECLLFIKTTKVMYEAVSVGVREVHPYSVPEIIAVPLIDGYDGYLRWVMDNVGAREGSESVSK